MRTKSFRIASLILGIALLSMALLSGPATAETRRLVVTLLGGKQVTLSVDAAPGTPVGSIPLPDLGMPVVSVSEVASAATPATTATSTTSGTTITGPPTTITAAPTTGTVPPTTATGPAAIGGIVQPKGQPKGKGSGSAVAVVPTTTQAGGGNAQAALQDASGSPATSQSQSDGAAPSPAAPGFTVAPPGPAPLGVPNFFIENFRIPPFLLPIYQAAGIQYSVPWQVLAAINEIETDYGRNLSVSSAGAVGWMQFMPSSWQTYGVDANGDGVKDPYNPVDAIFAAARYLKAAGAETDLSRAIFAYNHADWYVQSVLLRARVIGGMPADLVGSLTGLTQGHFPVAARATYADGLNAKAATRRVQGTNAAVPVEGNPSRRSINIFAKPGAPVIAVNDGRIMQLGENARLGRFVVLQDVYGNTYTYSHLGSIASRYPVPKPHTANVASTSNDLALPKADVKPTAAATAGAQPPSAATGGGKQRVAASGQGAGTSTTASAAATKERLFAHPERPAAYAAGGQRQLAELGQPLQSFDGYFTDALALDPHDYLLKPLQRGSSVIAGTILGRIGKTDPALAPHVEFAIRPAGRGAPQVDPKPILDGWKLLESTAIYRAKGVNAFAAANGAGPSIGQVMLMSKEQLERVVLADPRVSIYECGRQDIATGAIDRRVLATLEFLSASGLRLTVSALKCGHGYYTTSGNVSEHSSGDAVDIAAVNGIPISGHQGDGSITDITIRRLLTLQGTMKPHQIISLMTYPGTDNTLALPDHADHIHVGFHPAGSLLGDQRLQTILKPSQWTKLVEQLGSIPNPVVPQRVSKYAIKDGRGD
ncbi:MAG TPA: lytic murein transglycosylase [Conexibacter sp.]|jgi:murein DD-endopeptidase MepM/ murein hydrolase activator NlpD|nr:lytic murein transglycosylase [Conexibacter sp.]